jgi:dimethylhistidine N-methyltransferase
MNLPALTAPRWRLADHGPGRDELLGDVLAGLAARPRRLPSKYFYDARGSRLFEAITRQPEYYLTRVETALLVRRAREIARALGPELHVIEYGSGSGRKTRLLLAALARPVAYTPVEISRAALLDAGTRLAADFPALELLPVCADFTRPVPLPMPGTPPRGRLLFFPGSTLGNFVDGEAVALLAAMRATLGPGGRALVGIDLVKDPRLLTAAYNDAAGVTAAFTLNLLVRLNRELGGDFDLDGFRPRALYSEAGERIETDLVSLRAQDVRVAGRRFHFAAGEALRVECSVKYTDASFAALAARAGLRVIAGWNHPRDWFGLRVLQA